MTFQWIFKGFSLDFQIFKWIFDGFSMVFPWILNGVVVVFWRFLAAPLANPRESQGRLISRPGRLEPLSHSLSLSRALSLSFFLVERAQRASERSERARGAIDGVRHRATCRTLGNPVSLRMQTQVHGYTMPCGRVGRSKWRNC